MYHRQVSSSPRPVDAIISSRVDGSGPPTAEAEEPTDPREAAEDVAKVRLSISGVTGTPASAAECRDDLSAVRWPSRIHEVALSGSPLSNTEESAPDACA